MINATLTTVTGSTKGMSFNDRQSLLLFIEKMSEALPIGTVVNIDAPLIGIHSGWIQGKKTTLTV